MGVISTLSPEFRKKLIKELMVVASISFFACAILEFYVSWFFLAKLSTFFGVLYLILFFYFRAKPFNSAEDFLFLGSNLIITFYSNFIGKDADFHLYFYCLLIGVPILIPFKASFRFIFHISTPLACYFFLILNNFNLEKSNLVSAESMAILSDFNFVTAGFILGFFVYSLIGIYKNAENVLIGKEADLNNRNVALEKANKELDKFVYSIGHDLRSPIASVLGLVSLTKDEDNLVQIKEYCALQESSLLKLDAFIKEVLDYSRNERIEVLPELVDIKEFCNDLVTQHKFSAKAKDICFTVMADDIKVKIDKLRLSIVLNNLISNSIQYSDETKQSRKIDLTFQKNNHFLEFIISDNGVGIDSAHLHKIFDMFYRASYESKGSGLGLYIVKESIDKLKGKILVESELGKGSQFKVLIPEIA